MVIYKRTPTYAYSITDENLTAQQRWLIHVLDWSGLGICELAKKAHISRQYVSNILHQKNKLTFPMICAICVATGIPDDCEKVYFEVRGGKTNE